MPSASGGNTRYGRVDLQYNDFSHIDSGLFFKNGTGTGTISFDSPKVEMSYEVNPTFRGKLQEKGFNLTATTYSGTADRLAYSWLPGHELLEKSQADSIRKGMRFAHDIQMSTETLTQDDVDNYMKYRAALEEMIALGDSVSYLLTITVSVTDQEMGVTKTYCAKLYAPSGYMAELVDDVDIAQTNILF